MADFSADFRASSGIMWAPIDPFDFNAVFAPRVTDSSPPVLTIVSPPAATVISNVAPVVFLLSDDTGFALQDLWVGFGRTPKSYELAYDGETLAFIGNFSGSSKIDNVFTLVRAGGFPYQNRVRLRANVVDRGGNLVVIHA